MLIMAEIHMLTMQGVALTAAEVVWCALLIDELESSLACCDTLASI